MEEARSDMPSQPPRDLSHLYTALDLNSSPAYLEDESVEIVPYLSAIYLLTSINQWKLDGRVRREVER